MASQILAFSPFLLFLFSTSMVGFISFSQRMTFSKSPFCFISELQSFSPNPTLLISPCPLSAFTASTQNKIKLTKDNHWLRHRVTKQRYLAWPIKEVARVSSGTVVPVNGSKYKLYPQQSYSEGGRGASLPASGIPLRSSGRDEEEDVWC